MTSTHRRTVSGAIKAMRGLATASLVAGGGFLYSATALATPTAAPTTDTGEASGTAFAPYVDVSSSPAYDLVATANETGVRHFTLAFVGAGDRCAPLWGGHSALNANDVASQIDELRAEGGDVRVSFGGGSGRELAVACSGVDELAAAYGRVIDDFDLTRVDFRIGGVALSDRAAHTRRAQAVARLQKKHPDLDVSFTLPARPEGLPRSAVTLLADAHRHGVTISTVNIWATAPGAKRGGDLERLVERAATATQRQVRKVLGLPDGPAWQKVGITPTVGVNDEGGTFTVGDARRLVEFAQRHGAGRLSMWAAGRDQPCEHGATHARTSSCSSVDQEPLAFTKVFGTYR